MRKPTLTLTLILALCGLSAIGCSVHRQSSEFACIIDSECAQGRTCDRGYCVEHAGIGSNGCPDPCSSCDLARMTCEIECSATRPCEFGVECPAGYDCTVRCSAPDACQEVVCLDAKSCEITCSGARACGSINCGDGPCKTDCEGPRACSFVSCSNSCRCDVTCSGATMSQCPETSCPFNPDFKYCGAGGNIEGLCDSSQPQCDVCP